MGVTCNRMLPQVRSAAVGPATSIIFGVGREGVMNGGSNLNVLIDGRGRTLNGVVVPAIGADVTLTIYFRDTPTDALWLFDTVTIAVAVPAAAFANVGISPPDSSVYEVVIYASTAAVGAEDVIVSSLTTRAG